MLNQCNILDYTNDYTNRFKVELNGRKQKDFGWL